MPDSMFPAVPEELPPEVPQERSTEEPEVEQHGKKWHPSESQFALAHKGGETMQKYVEHEALKTMRVCESHKHKTHLFTYCLVSCLHCNPDFFRRCHRFGDRLYEDKKTKASTSSANNGSTLIKYKMCVSMIGMSQNTQRSPSPPTQA